MSTIVNFSLDENLRFETYKHILDVQCPIFIVHGTLDTTIPYNHSELLFDMMVDASSLETKKKLRSTLKKGISESSSNVICSLVVNGANHNNLYLYEELYVEIDIFLKKNNII